MANVFIDIRQRDLERGIVYVHDQQFEKRPVAGDLLEFSDLQGRRYYGIVRDLVGTWPVGAREAKIEFVPVEE